MLNRVKILYCSDRATYLEMLRKSDVFTGLRVPNILRGYINNLILTEQVASKRGILKYLSITYQGDLLTKEEIETIAPGLKSSLLYVSTTNRFTTISIFNNNLTYILKQTEIILKYLETITITERPKINISTDLDGIKGIRYMCSDISSYMDIIQFTTLEQQKGDIYLGLADLSDELVGMLLLSSINANGNLKIHLLCNNIDRDIWKLRGIEILQRLNVNLNFDILDTILIAEEV